MRQLLLITFLLGGMIATSQVGIQTTNPNASLDITASDTSIPQNTDGLLIPRISNFPATNPNAVQQSMLVYLTTDRTGVNINGTPQDYDTGFYYWDNSITNWVSFISSSVTSNPAYGEIYSNADVDDVSNTTPVGFSLSGPSGGGVTLSTNSITVSRIGVYRVTYTISIEKDGSGGSEEIEFFLTQGLLSAGGFEIPGTRTYTDTSNDPDSAAVTRSVFVDVTTINQTFYVYPNVTNNDVIILSGSSLSIELID